MTRIARIRATPVTVPLEAPLRSASHVTVALPVGLTEPETSKGTVGAATGVGGAGGSMLLRL